MSQQQQSCMFCCLAVLLMPCKALQGKGKHTERLEWKCNHLQAGVVAGGKENLNCTGGFVQV